MTRRPERRACLIAIALLTISACASQSPVASRLDSSGVTIVTLDEAIVLSRPILHLTASARDYAYLGPVEINNMGSLDHYLWVGLATTVDRALVGSYPPDAHALAILVDGQPMVLPLTEWHTGLDQPPYETVLPLYAILAARASLDQIQRVAGGGSVEVHLISESAVTAHYRVWQGRWPSWSLFGNRRKP